jgi:hypothetical protein
MTARLRHVRIELAEANAFVLAHHRRHGEVVGHIFSLGAALDEPCANRIVGVVIVGRPVSRIRDDGETAEVSRLCTDGTRNACSFLYGAAARAAFALGFRRIGTYIAAGEPGTTLRAAGWRQIGETKGRSWDTPGAGRPRIDRTPLQDRLLFERGAP